MSQTKRRKPPSRAQTLVFMWEDQMRRYRDRKGQDSVDSYDSLVNYTSEADARAAYQEMFGDNVVPIFIRYGRKAA